MDNLNLYNKRVLVTGGNGYLGTNLVNSLKESGADIFIIDKKINEGKNEYCIDITDKNEVEKVINEIKPQLIFHLAALLNRERDFSNHEMITKVNYNGTINLLLALKDINYDNFIFTSTSEVYGSNKAPFNEEMIPNPASPYSMSKLFAEIAIRTFSDIHNKNYTILRLFNFFGKNMPKNFFIPQLINSLKHETSFKMTKGQQKRDFLHINDVINAIILTINNENANNETFNICSGKAITIKKFANKCNRIVNNNCKIEFGALKYRENEIWNMVGDNSKIKSKLGFKMNYEIKNIISEILLD